MWKYLAPDEQDDSVPDEWVWERLRDRRNRLLTASDFRLVSDAPWDPAPWLVYRQALRDLPDNTSDPRLAVWPTAPDGSA